MVLGKARKIHFIGIGGIGMSGIAELLINLGFSVSGSDLEETEITRRLAAMGARVSKGHGKENIEGADIVVVSSAIKPANPELASAIESGIPVIPRSDMLGELMRIRTGIAVAGAHGKTTTTSLAAVVLQEAGLDPTIVVGGKVKNLDTNARLGGGKFIVAEVDESDGNFVRLSPVFAIITNIDEEHLDFYGGLEKIYEAFVTFARRVPFHGAVICCSDDPHVRAVIPRIDRRIVTYGTSPDADVRAKITGTGPTGTTFELTVGGEKRGELFLNMPGGHNVLNALAVCALSEELETGFDDLKRAFAGFKGVGRRFEIKGERDGILIVDDYGHHPTEIRAAIETARSGFDRRVVVLFQPHRYTRTRDLHELFSGCFNSADEIFITGIYAAGERPIPGVTGEIIYREALRGGAKNISYVPEMEDLEKAVLESIRSGDLVLTLGAGDIYKVGEKLLSTKGSGKE